jgi:hypothetical protein
MEIDVYEYVFPIVGGNKQKNQKESVFLLKQVFGTAFSIGSDAFITAGHVIKSSRKNEWCGIGYRENGFWKTSSMKKSEIIDEFDLGIVISDGIQAKSHSWTTNELAMSVRILSAGYPYAFDQEQMSINVRAFTGNIVSVRTFYALDSKPKIYELQFQCPRGLSGAPLLGPGTRPKVAGFVIGNHSTEMLVYSDREVIEETNSQTIVERYEALQLGIAIQSNVILDCYSHILGCTLRDHLQKQRLIAQ